MLTPLMDLVSSMCCSDDVLLVAGDVCDDIILLENTLAVLAERFSRVFYCVGNHELWIRPADEALGLADSLTKLQRVLAVCAELGVATAPERLGNVWIAPLHSWHHTSWDTEPDIPGVPGATPMTIADYAACRWPTSVPGGGAPGSLDLAEWFDEMNDASLWSELLATRSECDVISFSHFLPRLELLPEKRFLFFPNLAKASGSVPLQRRLEALKPDIHVFGHSHFAWDACLGGVRYIQAPLSSPAERHRRLRTVCFDAFMQQGQRDPEAASWLPVEIYRFNEAPPLSASTARQPAPQKDGPAAGTMGSTDELTARSEAMHAVQAVLREGQPDDDPQAAARNAPGNGEAPRHLHHGTMPGRLGAHWCEYYEANARTPEVTTMAPWVAGLYDRRRQRNEKKSAAAAAAADAEG